MHALPSLNHAIGLDLGPTHVRAVQFRRLGRPGAAAAVASFPRRETGPLLGADEAARVARVLDRQGFSGRTVVVGVPDELLLSATLELPPGPAPPLEAAARVELARSAGCGPMSLEVSCWRLPAGTRGRESAAGLAAGCLHRDATALLDALEAGGLVPVALEPRPAAAVRACGALFAETGSICGLVEIDGPGTVITITNQGAITYTRFAADRGLAALAGRLAQDLSIVPELAERLLARLGAPAAGPPAGPEARTSLLDEARPLVREYLAEVAEDLALALSYAAHRYPEAAVGPVVVAGPGARLHATASALAERIETPVTIANPAAQLGESPIVPGPLCDPGVLVAAGLARHHGVAA
ncbi:MAG TPA: hypothetical protein VD963_00310 [Phycisphaerales bacterium]|nr:hypothetical protein [Phycisphaerales bacterium]